ncbi:MAG: STAS domain-containing protein [Flavobacteriaceae bacterium]|jgi:anti-anti-sigma factor|uniref:STAS domain-containing protein n=1 Tax=Flagellimonas TaxID=444459 RepID=UPI000E2355FE|nr:STAS domain-containing protein [Flavobacteriaceae bacterium]
MALQITEVRGVFSVNGELNSMNVNILERHMDRFISPKRPIILNLERVKSMDSTAARVLQKMYVRAIKGNSILSIVGWQNRNVLQVLKQTKTSYILSNDRA